MINLILGTINAVDELSKIETLSIINVDTKRTHKRAKELFSPWNELLGSSQLKNRDKIDFQIGSVSRNQSGVIVTSKREAWDKLSWAQNPPRFPLQKSLHKIQDFDLKVQLGEATFSFSVNCSSNRWCTFCSAPIPLNLEGTNPMV